jgi:hypothetical protein
MYRVVFTRATSPDQETISAAGLFEAGANRLSFLGIHDIVVRPGAPAQAVWNRPIPKIYLDGSNPETINRGMELEVTVEVQDRFGNAVDQAVRVNAVSSSAAIGDVGTPGTFNIANNSFANREVLTNPATGMATLSARVTNGQTQQVFDLIATLPTVPAAATCNPTQTCVGALRIGRVLDRLEVFYADTVGAGTNNLWQEYQDMNVSIFGRVGDWFQVTVKAVAPDTVIRTKIGCVMVEPSNPNIILSNAPSVPATPMTTFPMTGGSTTFWIGASPGTSMDITNACLDVTMMLADCNTPDHSIMGGNRCGITFSRPTSNVLRAVVFGDGFGRPDSVYVVFHMDGQSFVGPNPAELPDSVMLRWPSPTADATAITVRRSQVGVISAVDSSTIRVSFRGQATALGQPFPSGYTTNIGGNDGIELVTVYGGLGSPGTVSDALPVFDGIGPVIAGLTGEGIPNTWAPMIVENLRPGEVADTLIILLSEEIADNVTAARRPLEGESILFTQDLNPPALATGGIPINVQTAILDVSLDANNRGFKLVLAAGSQVPRPGNWIRLNPAVNVTDNVARTVDGYSHPNNPAHLNNRWVQVIERPTPPDIVSAYYTSNDQTGKLNFAYVTFNKAVDPVLWFSGGVIELGTGSANIINVDAAGPGFLTVSPSDPNTMVVDLSRVPRYNTHIITGSGAMEFRAQFGTNPMVDGWSVVSVGTIDDRANPVLALAAVLQIGAQGDTPAQDANDTLIVTYSEDIPRELLSTVTQPVVFVRQATGTTYPPMNLRFIDAREVMGPSGSGTSYLQVRYEVMTPIPPDRIPVNGDSIYINPSSGIADISQNIQENPLNLRQPITVERTVTWRLTVRNNPFRGGDTTTIVLRPGLKDANVRVTGRFRILNNLGNIVVDRPFISQGGEDDLQIPWDGRNNKGRFVGTGTYMMIVTADAEVCLPDGTGCVSGGSGSRFRETRMIGFIRK